ncbi:MAG: glycosyltransferase family 4 protein [Solirubrobacterales bacterium]
MTVRVAIDARDAARPEQGGWARYAHRLIEALREQPDVEVLAYEAGPRHLPELVFEQLTFARRAASDGAHVIHAPNCFLPLRRNCPGVVTVHDLAFETHRDDFTGTTGWKYRTFTPRAVRSAECVIVPSEATARSVAEHYGVGPDRVRVIPEASPLPVAAIGSDVRQPVPTGRFVLTVGALRRKKNLERLLEAHARARERGLTASLVVVGEGPHLFDATPGVEFLGRVSDERLDALYRAATLFVYPSLHEGFGLTVLEAMERGCPCLLAEGTSLPEVGGSAAAYVDPTDTVQLADHLLELCGDDDRLDRMAADGRRRAEQFSWERTARETVAAYREAVRAGG